MADPQFEHNAAYLIAEIDRLLSREYDRRMRALGLTRAQWWVLAQLHFNDGVTQTELAADLGLGKAALGGLLDRLEAKGWIERRPHPRDRRAKCVYRTRAVQRLLAEMRRIALEMSREQLAGLGRADREALVALLRRLRAHLAQRDSRSTRGETDRP